MNSKFSECVDLRVPRYLRIWGVYDFTYRKVVYTAPLLSACKWWLKGSDFRMSQTILRFDLHVSHTHKKRKEKNHA